MQLQYKYAGTSNLVDNTDQFLILMLEPTQVVQHFLIERTLGMHYKI